MSSLAGKMSLLVDEYNHSKTSPAYRKLSIKYKALKKSNQDLIRLLTSLFAAECSSENDYQSRRKSSSKKTQTETFCNDIADEEYVVDELAEYYSRRANMPQSVHHISDSKIEEDLESELCQEEEEEETEDPDIKEQIVQEQVAESFAIKEEETEEIEEEEEEEEVVEVVEEEVEETEEIEEIEVVEEVEVEETEEIEEVEVEEEEEEAGVYEIEINGTRYYTTNEKDGIVYAVLDDEDVGDEVGKFVNGKLVLNA